LRERMPPRWAQTRAKNIMVVYFYNG